MATTTAVPKFDLKREHEDLYRARVNPSLVQVPTLRYLMIDGDGPPSGSAFQEAIQALYSMAFTLKFQLKKAGRFDWVVAPLEALWWTPSGDWPPAGSDPSGVRWRAMIVQPPTVELRDIEEARQVVARRRWLPALLPLRFDTYDEGTAAQVLHLGPYDAERTTIARVHRFIRDQGYRPHLAHHEIYLSNPGRTKPAMLRTIIRQPVTD
jgi:hypothetical protein